MHPEHVPENGTFDDILDTVNGWAAIHEAFRYTSATEIITTPFWGASEKSRTSIRLERTEIDVFVTIQEGGTSFSSVEEMKNDKLLNNVSPKFLPYVGLCKLLLL